MKVEAFENYAASGYNRIPVYEPTRLFSKDELSLLIQVPQRMLMNFRDEKNHDLTLLSLHSSQEIRCHHRKIEVIAKTSLKKSFDIDTIPPVNPLAWLSDYHSYFNVPFIEEIPRFCGGLIGYIGATLNEFTEVYASRGQDQLLPDFIFLLTDDLILIDHTAETAWIITYVDPIIRNNCFERAKQHLTILMQTIENEISEKKIVSLDTATSLKATESFDENALLSYAHQHHFPQLTLYQQTQLTENGYIVFEKNLKTTSQGFYFFHFDDFYLFGFGESEASKIHQSISMPILPSTYPPLLINDDWIKSSKSYVKSTLARLCLEGSVRSEGSMMTGELPPKYSAINYIEAVMPHLLQYGNNSALSIDVCENYMPNAFSQQRGMIGILNWHDDFIGQYCFNSYLHCNETLYHASPVFITSNNGND
jgi:hypothetical protein